MRSRAHSERWFLAPRGYVIPRPNFLRLRGRRADIAEIRVLTLHAGFMNEKDYNGWVCRAIEPEAGR